MVWNQYAKPLAFKGLPLLKPLALLKMPNSQPLTLAASCREQGAQDMVMAVVIGVTGKETGS